MVAGGVVGWVVVGAVVVAGGAVVSGVDVVPVDGGGGGRTVASVVGGGVWVDVVLGTVAWRPAHAASANARINHPMGRHQRWGVPAPIKAR